MTKAEIVNEISNRTGYYIRTKTVMQNFWKQSLVKE